MEVSDVDLEKRKIILDAFKKGQGRTKAKERIEERFGDCIGYGVRTCERWLTKFKQGDFDLIKKPRDKCYLNRDRTYQKKKRPAKTTKKVKEVTFKQQNVTTKPSLKKNKKVKKTTEPELPKRILRNSVTNKNTAPEIKQTTNSKRKQRPTPLAMPKLLPVADRTKCFDQNDKEKMKEQPEMPKLRPRRPRSQGIEIKLPASAAKRMTSQTLTEKHKIGVGYKNSSKSTKNGKRILTQNSGSKEVTVQFENLAPTVVKNTVCKDPKVIFTQQQNTDSNLQIQQHPCAELKITNVKHIESLSPSPEKRQQFKHETTLDVSYESPTTTTTITTPTTTTPTSNLSSPKGVIYLNPEEIFRTNFSNLRKNKISNESSFYKKPVQQNANYKTVMNTLRLQQQQTTKLLLTNARNKLDAVVLTDSDDDENTQDDLVFPKDIPLPAPKFKTDTFTTYWDMETGSLIPLNAGKEPILHSPAVAVIEID